MHFLEWEGVRLGGGAIDNRTGSRFAQRVGGACGPRYGAVCGRARYRFEACLELVCSVDDCGGDAPYQARKIKAQKGACKAVSFAYAAACPNEVDLLPLCENVFQAIATSCSGGPTTSTDADFGKLEAYLKTKYAIP